MLGEQGDKRAVQTVDTPQKMLDLGEEGLIAHIRQSDFTALKPRTKHENGADPCG